VQLSKRTLPSSYGKKINSLNVQVKSLPFYLKECGFSNERKFVTGSKNDYSDYLLFYCISGVIRYDKNHASTFLRANDIAVSACNVPLTFIRSSKECQYIYIIVSGTHAKQYYNSFRNKSGQYTSNPLSYLLDNFIDLYDMKFDDKLLPNMEASLIIHNIMTELYKHSCDILEARAMTPVQENVVNTALKYINNNYSNPLDIDTICNEVSFSKYYFCKLFKKHVGMTVHQYIEEFRIIKAKELLSYSKLSVGAVATSVGYKNTLAFSRAFERATSMTPTEFRRYY